jgi:site-specific recombinase XerD
MNALIPVEADSLVPFTAEEQDTLRLFAENEKAASTRACYRKDFAAFEVWCISRGLCPLPASPATVARHIAWAAIPRPTEPGEQDGGGLAVSSIGRRLAGIAYAHKLAKLPSPCAADDVRVILAGIRRSLTVAPRRKAAATADILRAMLQHCPDTMRGCRDRALLAVGFCAALRRSELVALTVADVTPTKDGMLLTIRRSKTDQCGEGAQIAVLRGVRICPVESLERWLERSGIMDGPLFRPVLKGGRIQSEPLSGFSVAQTVKHYAKLAGLDPTNFSAHSLRAGLITSAAEHGASIWKIKEVSRHKSDAVLGSYVRSASAFKDHCAAAFS